MKIFNLVLSMMVIIILVSLCLFCINWDFFHSPQGLADQEKPTGQKQVLETRLLPGEHFIKAKMFNPDGTLRTNLQPRSKSVPELALGEETLSESLGLWLVYALEKDDQALFDEGVHILTTRFLQDGWIYWKLSHEEQVVTTNALIDDLRIMDALYVAATKWGKKSYQSTADEIAQSILKRHVVETYFVDFYDYQAQWTSKALTLSYLQTSALMKMYERQLLSEGLYQEAIQLLENLPTRKGFFPFSYQLVEQEYVFEAEVNLIDQLYIVYHRAQAGIGSEPLWNFLKQEFYLHKLLYGRYDLEQKKPSVHFESPAVYSLAILSALELGESEFAVDLYYRLIRQQTLNPESEWYGGYMDYSQDDTHIFDNLLPLLAERKLYNEGLLY